MAAVPTAFLEPLGKRDVRDVALGDGLDRTMTVLFSDVRSFTTISEALTPGETFGFLNDVLSRAGPVIREHGGIVDKYVGDAIAVQSAVGVGLHRPSGQPRRRLRLRSMRSSPVHSSRRRTPSRACCCVTMTTALRATCAAVRSTWPAPGSRGKASIKRPNRSAMSERIGFVGVGRMGANMARRLQDVGYTVAAVYDVDHARARELAQELGALAPEKLAGVTAASDIVITVVTDDAAMHAIFATSGDSLLTGASGKTFINAATITPGVHVAVDKLITGAGAVAIEACMASSIPQARNGELYLMCAGDEAAYARLTPMLAKMSSSMRWIGGPGSAAQVKALVNMLMNINTAGLAEALALGDALGLDLTMLRDVFSQTGANSRVLATDGEDMQNREHDTYFSAAHAAKDSGIALELGHAAGVIMPLAEATKQQYDRMVEAGLGELDKSGIAELTFNERRPSNLNDG